MITGTSEVSETVFGGQEEVLRGSKNNNKKLVVVGIEKKNGVSRLYAREIPHADVVSQGSFMRYHIAQDAKVTTDQWTGYTPLGKDFANLVQVPDKKGGNFPELHRTIMGLKGWLRGMLHHV